jgi:crotonobetainyl-CoA:carnitine CoA-transferase CaiB-like acyl-CoA transferase
VVKLDYDHIAARLYAALVPYAPVNTPLDLVNEKHLTEGGYWMNLKVGDKPFRVPRIPIAMERTAQFTVRENPGALGAHTDAILANLGYSTQQIDALKAEKIVLRSDKMLNTDPSDAEK